MSYSSEMSVGEVEVMSDPETFWIFNSYIKSSMSQHFGSKFPILQEMLTKLESEPDVVILRRIAENALSPELVNSANSAISLLFAAVGQPPEITRKIRKKFNRLVRVRMFINLINDVALKTETEVELLSSMPSINSSDECIST